MLDTNSVEWRIDELGVTSSEGAVFEFTVRHTGNCDGEVEVNQSVEYTDTEGNVLNFPSPTLDVECGTPIVEPCPNYVDYTAVGCSDTIVFDAGNVEMQSQGRMVMVNFTIPRVCPNKRVAVAVVLNELDDEDNEYKRGLKTFTIPAHTQESCRDVEVRCVKFVLPEDLDVFDTNGICNARQLRVRVIAHYVDNDFQCCEEILTSL